MLIDLRDIVVKTLEDEPVRVYLFGSWAREEEKQTSDIDVTIQSNGEIPMSKWVELRDRIEESTIPYHVDLVDLTAANEQLKERVKEEGVLWKDYRKELNLLNML
ncbi:nucleotidyltransferase domain-containing protein [Virgibacillus sp. MSP4-1]|uniref:nucleotidyltransferase family protein n=1 Tax=Virgibacillus sp. MSP4-1 TaxID=2700081 RepID=UPI00039E8E54|nr:nucleotidyltransferase domain-containing protein [Virgibacillus sp. MSP4-1]QHS23202.1 nucleotidyltransferase domain-containing protein [Virgibacillus sp. MSP4-1]